MTFRLEGLRLERLLFTKVMIKSSQLFLLSHIPMPIINAARSPAPCSIGRLSIQDSSTDSFFSSAPSTAFPAGRAPESALRSTLPQFPPNPLSKVIHVVTLNPGNPQHLKQLAEFYPGKPGIIKINQNPTAMSFVAVPVSSRRD